MKRLDKREVMCALLIQMVEKLHYLFTLAKALELAYYARFSETLTFLRKSLMNLGSILI